jgi:membrane fusion protein, multidrug efflux system
MSNTDAKTPLAPAASPGAPAGRETAPGNGRPDRRRRNIFYGLGTLAVLALGIGGYWFCFMRGIVFTDDARFGGHLVDLAPEINARLLTINFHEGQSVHRGDEVFRLDSASARAALSQAEAALQSARASQASNRAKLEKLVNGSRPEEIRAAEATARRLANEAELAELNFTRVQTLFKQGSAPQDELDRTRTALESARQSRENAAQNLAVFQQGSRKEDVDAARADLDLAQSRVAEATAAVERARTDLDHCVVQAPFDGWVVRRWLDPGAMPIVAQPVVSLFDPTTLRVDANIEEKYLYEVAIGDAADLTIDAFPDVRLTGRVAEILRATNSEFSLIPAEGVSGTFIKVTQRVSLRIAVEAPPELALGPGLSVEVKIRVGSAAANRAEAAHVRR